MPTLSEDLAFRGLIHQMTDPDLPKRLDKPGLTVYAGFDPTADSLHVGNLLQLCMLRRFQTAGHRPIALAGGGTGMIGDPGGKQDERKLLGARDARSATSRHPAPARRSSSTSSGDRAPAAQQRRLAEPALDLEFLRDVGKHFTVNEMLAKESVKSRLERPEQGISYTEFSYMLLQAYDFLRLHDDHGCQLQVGGSDQWGNITTGVDLHPQGHAATRCGVSPRRSSSSPTVPSTARPRRARSGSTPSARAPSPCTSSSSTHPTSRWATCLRYLTFLDHDEIRALDAQTAEHPQRRAAQRALAARRRRAGARRGEVAKCEEASAALFGEEIARLSEEMLLAVTEDAPTTLVARVPS